MALGDQSEGKKQRDLKGFSLDDPVRGQRIHQIALFGCSSEFVGQIRVESPFEDFADHFGNCRVTSLPVLDSLVEVSALQKERIFALLKEVLVDHAVNIRIRKPIEPFVDLSKLQIQRSEYPFLMPVIVVIELMGIGLPLRPLSPIRFNSCRKSLKLYRPDP